MSTFHLSRRSVPAGSAGAAVVSLATVSGQARAAAPAPAAEAVARSGYRWRNAVMDGTGSITGVLFHRGVQYGEPV
ncbi:hypothetical protein ACFWCB_12375 [Streptomyces sp. NPDC060048]|uniref:hypothetical protein n=1 Tax=unclassified Streptomyces TaxID=2593676 RepID=UPI0036A00EFB